MGKRARNDSRADGGAPAKPWRCCGGGGARVRDYTRPRSCEPTSLRRVSFADKCEVTTLEIDAWHAIERTDAPARADRAIGWWALVLLCVTSAAIGRLVYLVKTFDADGAMFVYMGKLTSEGGRLCHDLVDNKFPTVGLVTSAAWRAFGANWSGYVLLGAALSFTTALLLARIARRHVGASAVLPVALFALVYLNFNPAVFGGFQLETMQVFLAVL